MTESKDMKRADMADGMIVAHSDVAIISVTPTISSTDAQVSGDYIGTSGVPMTFANVAREAGLSGVIVGALLIDKSSGVGVAGELWLFDTAVTPPSNSAAWSITDADAAHCLGIIPFSTYYASALNCVSPAAGLSILFQCVAGSKDIYGCFVTRGAPVYENGDLTLVLRVWQD